MACFSQMHENTPRYGDFGIHFSYFLDHIISVDSCPKLMLVPTNGWKFVNRSLFPGLDCKFFYMEKFLLIGPTSLLRDLYLFRNLYSGILPFVDTNLCHLSLSHSSLKPLDASKCSWNSCIPWYSKTSRSVGFHIIL